MLFLEAMESPNKNLSTKCSKRFSVPETSTTIQPELYGQAVLLETLHSLVIDREKSSRYQPGSVRPDGSFHCTGRCYVGCWRKNASRESCELQ